MEFNNDQNLNDKNDHSNQNNNSKPNAWVVEGDKNLDENDLERSFTDADKVRSVSEGEGMGGGNFGKNNLTTSANDKNNPSQNAGNTNTYSDRTEPSEEHPENSNFKVKEQDGQPDYSKAQPQSSIPNSDPKPEKPERGNGENDRPHEEGSYQEGTADNDGPNIPGPDELPDQQKVGEDVDEDTYKKDHENTAN